MSENYDDLSPSELLRKYNEVMNDGITDLELSTLDKLTLDANPKLLLDRYNDTSKAILFKHFVDIMTAQVDKAKKGDTTAAKFITEFCAPSDDDVNLKPVDTPEWEVKAIALRDKLQLELSAVELVTKLLDYASGLSPAKLAQLLTPNHSA